MKRKLLILTLALSMFGLINFALAQDPGVKDTCAVERLSKVLPGSQVVVNVFVINDGNVGGFSIPLAFPDSVSGYDITCDSVSFVGTRTTTAMFSGSNIDNTKNRLVFYAAWLTALAPGNGSVAKIYFTAGPTWDSTVSVPIKATFYPPSNNLEFSNESGQAYTPEYAEGALEVKEVNTPTKPTVFSLSQNYPNPFNPKTLIRFGLPKDSWVKLEVYNILGQKVKTLVDEKLTAGLKEVEWDGMNDNGLEVGSGIYFYKIKADDFSDVKKMLMLK